MPTRNRVFATAANHWAVNMLTHVVISQGAILYSTISSRTLMRVSKKITALIKNIPYMR